MTKLLFSTGNIVATPGALDMLMKHGKTPAEYLSRHMRGDWGDLGVEDTKENTFSLRHDLRLFSAYDIGEDRLWIITEADRSATTLLLPEEY